MGQSQSQELALRKGFVLAIGSRDQRARKWKRTPLFEAWVIVDGVRRKATHLELREGYRLWAAHKDIRLGRWTGR